MFKVGDKVTMSLQGTRWCEIRNGDFWRDGSNPFGIEGIVVRISGHKSLPLTVHWSNKHINSYSEGDLTYYNLSLENE